MCTVLRSCFVAIGKDALIKMVLRFRISIECPGQWSDLRVLRNKCLNVLGQRSILFMVDDLAYMFKQFQLLSDLLLLRAESTGMGISNIREDTDGGLNDLLQALHLSRGAYACLENGNLVFRANLKHAQRNSNLTIPRAWISDDIQISVQELVGPFLDNGLAVTSCYADNRNIELLSMMGGQLMKCFQHVLHLDLAGVLFFQLNESQDDKGPNALARKILYVPVAIVSLT